MRPEDLALIPVLASQPGIRRVRAPGVVSIAAGRRASVCKCQPDPHPLRSDPAGRKPERSRHGQARLRHRAPGHEHRPGSLKSGLLRSPSLSRRTDQRRSHLCHSRSQARSLHPPNRSPGQGKRRTGKLPSNPPPRDRRRSHPHHQGLAGRPGPINSLFQPLPLTKLAFPANTF